MEKFNKARVNGGSKVTLHLLPRAQYHRGCTYVYNIHTYIHIHTLTYCASRWVCNICHTPPATLTLCGEPLTLVCLPLTASTPSTPSVASLEMYNNEPSAAVGLHQVCSSTTRHQWVLSHCLHYSRHILRYSLSSSPLRRGAAGAQTNYDSLKVAKCLVI